MEGARTNYKNSYSKEHYDRLELRFPKGEKERIKQMSDALGLSINEYVYRLVSEDLALNHSRLQDTKFSTEDISLLEKWQIPKKYYEMIEQCSFSKETGYYILLKQGYINDISGSRTIICQKTLELRATIVKSHKVVEEVQQGEHDYMTLEQLKKWQIPKMYYEMIESIDSEKGRHTIVLKSGYINDYSGSRVITVEKANMFRTVMKGKCERV